MTCSSGHTRWQITQSTLAPPSARNTHRLVPQDVIKTISSSHGQVLRIVIFKKNGVQAMVEFDSVESAARAKEVLTGADIYSGCCTLRIEFAKVGGTRMLACGDVAKGSRQWESP